MPMTGMMTELFQGRYQADINLTERRYAVQPNFECSYSECYLGSGALHIDTEPMVEIKLPLSSAEQLIRDVTRRHRAHSHPTVESAWQQYLTAVALVQPPSLP